MRGKVIVSGVVILLLSGGLVAADYWFKERPVQIAMQPDGGVNSSQPTNVAQIPTASGALSTGSGAIRHSVKKGSSTKKQGGPDILTLLLTLNLVPLDTKEASLLQLTSPAGTTVTTVVLLKNNDRSFLFAWLESDDVKNVFSSLKQALQEQFSGKVQDLIDESRTQTDGPPTDILSFYDPVISNEKIIFIRVRSRLYEIHVVKGNEQLADELIKALSK